MIKAILSAMKRRLRNALYLAILVGFATVSLAAGPMGSGGNPMHKVRCSACGMSVAMFADSNARIEFKDSTRAVFDGAKCMFKYHLDVKKYDPSKSRDDVSAIFVKDYNSKEDIDARLAFYVVWSDVYGPMGHEPIPFRNDSEAKKFMKDHQGKQVLKLAEITTELITSLDNPP
jgi:copper chaperone NosL